MSPLTTSLLSTTTGVYEISVIFAGALSAVAFRPSDGVSKPRPHGAVSRHTLYDIGVEPGRLTWVR